MITAGVAYLLGALLLIVPAGPVRPCAPGYVPPVGAWSHCSVHAECWGRLLIVNDPLTGRGRYHVCDLEDY